MKESARHRFAEQLAARRRARGWDQAELGRRISATATTISRWENGHHSPERPHHIVGLKRELGFTTEDFLEAFGAQPATNLGSDSNYRALSFVTAADLLGSFDRILDEFGRLEEQFPVPMEPGEYGTDTKWPELMHLSPETGGVLFYKDLHVVGYWQCLAVKEETYSNIVNGSNFNESISLDDIVLLMEPGVYKLLFLSLFLAVEHRNFVTRKLLRDDFLNFIRQTAAEDILFDKIIANITGNEVKQICKNLGFHKIIDHPVHKYFHSPEQIGPAEIFELSTSGDSLLFSQDAFLSERYRRLSSP